MVFPINFLVVFLFRKSRPYNKKTSRLKEAINKMGTVRSTHDDQLKEELANYKTGTYLQNYVIKINCALLILNNCIWLIKFKFRSLTLNLMKNIWLLIKNDKVWGSIFSNNIFPEDPYSTLKCHIYQFIIVFFLLY